MQVKRIVWTEEQFNQWLQCLVHADWSRDKGAIYFKKDLTAQDLAPVAFAQNARAFLSALAEAGGAEATVTGNLNRKFISLVRERLILPDLVQLRLTKYCKVVNETDIWQLHLLRVFSEFAGLIQLRGKRWRVTRAGRELLDESRIGELYRELFLARFRKFDLEYDFHFRSVPLIQHALAVTLWRLEVVAENWVPVKGLAGEVLLHPVLEQLRNSMVSEYDTEEWILSGYVLAPLINCGLLESKAPEGWNLEDTDIRITPLWSKFVGFETGERVLEAPGGVQFGLQ